MPEVERLVAFAILMESDGGIVHKHPSYILEKWELCNSVSIEALPALLDNFNRGRFTRWCRTFKGGDRAA